MISYNVFCFICKNKTIFFIFGLVSILYIVINITNRKYILVIIVFFVIFLILIGGLWEYHQAFIK